MTLLPLREDQEPGGSGDARLPLLLAALEESDQASDEEVHEYHHPFCRTVRGYPVAQTSKLPLGGLLPVVRTGRLAEDKRRRGQCDAP